MIYPSAFPTGDHNSEDGMSLRDWFAGQALIVFLERGYGFQSDDKNAVDDAYRVADLMIDRRKVR